jgi:nitrous oxidase accessory protein
MEGASKWAALALVLVCFFGSSALAQHGHGPGEKLVTWRPPVKPGSLQTRIDALQPGQTLRLSGVNQGPIHIKTQGITLEGDGTAVIDGQRRDSVIVVEADNVTIRNLTVRGSGDFNPNVDAGIAVVSTVGTTIDTVKIEDALFGIDVSASNQVVIANSDISSKNVDPTLQGDAIRIWAAKDVEVRDSFWHDARDVVAWYSERVRIVGNRATRTRYSVHSMYSKSLMIENNEFEANSVGIFIMYGVGTTVLNNTIRRSAGLTGIGLGLKETSSVYASGNSFVYCATGILLDNSPWEPNTKNWIVDNQLVSNDVAVLLANDRDGNDITGNEFRGNRVDVDTEQRRKSPGKWLGNYWDQYEGFDRDLDGVGDTPHIPRKYGDQITGEHPSTRYFSGAPVLVLIGLIERLVPMTEPIELLVDPSPRRARKVQTAPDQGGQL